jgi:hypothetical protein
MKTNGIEQKIQKQTHTTIAICFLAKVPKICTWKMIVSLTNSVGKTGYPPVED